MSDISPSPHPPSTVSYLRSHPLLHDTNKTLQMSTITGDQWLDIFRIMHEEHPQKAYLDVLGSQLRHLFPDFVRNLQLQTLRERQRSRAAVIEYGDASIDHKTFESLRELQTYFQQPVAQQQPRRRLFLLEDLSRDYIEIIGSQLLIHPRFFGAHWADPTHPNFNYRSPFTRYTENNFVIRYPSTLPVRVNAAAEVHGTIFRFDTNVNRHIHCYDPKGPLVDQPKGYHVMSFWSSGIRNDGSWDSILLVDPPIRDHVVSLRDGSLLTADHSSKEHAYTRMHTLAPDFNESTILSLSTLKHGQPGVQPQYTSMFDDILSLTITNPVAFITPRTCTETARKLVISVFLTYLRRRILNMLSLQANTCSAVLTLNRCDYLKKFGQGALGSWQHDLFGFVVNVKYIMGLMSKETDDNMVALGLNCEGLGTANAAPQWELDGWLSIQEHCTRSTSSKSKRFEFGENHESDNGIHSLVDDCGDFLDDR
ncbi:hypothetical protein J1614_008557 [Plenodomus biglobosus]|nr:hypothetical protein J1614_008557 [Plenodomus biglobosus]